MLQTVRLAETVLPLPRLSRLSRSELPSPGPIRVVQFGEGNFLRAFVDWMLQHLNDSGLFRGSVRIVEPLPYGMGDLLNEQDGLYTVLLRGLENGEIVDKTELISCVEGSCNAYRQWNEVLALARKESLQFVFSNTTEAGIEYKPEAYSHEKTPNTFPAKLTAFLYERFRALDGHPGSGLCLIPCELIEQNGTFLKKYVLRYAGDWNLGGAFSDWIERENRFVNTLVDRIVTGYPKTDAEELCMRLGYEDRLLAVGEPFHFLVLEGPESMETILPLRKAGLNVVWTNDATPYRRRKVLLLNGGHTSIALASFLAGLDYVDETMADPLLGRFLRDLLREEVLPAIDLPEKEKTDYLERVLERFANPFARHTLYSITLNSVSKWKVRVLPSLTDVLEKTGRLPKRLVFSLAALIVFYENVDGIGKRENGLEYEIPDNPGIRRFFESAWKESRRQADFKLLARNVLARNEFWDRDLNEIDGLGETVAAWIERIDMQGIHATLNQDFDVHSVR